MSHTTTVVSRLVLAAILTSPILAARADTFSLRLEFTNAHLRELFFGCHQEATAAYDRGIDDFAPPPGIATGYVGFVSSEKLPLFYRDIRGPEGPHEWTLQIRVHNDHPVDVSWEKEALPEDWSFSLRLEDRILDMSRTQKVRVAESATLTIHGRKKPATRSPDKQD